MITPMIDVPGTVLGFEASGKIHADDYESVLAPAIEARLAAGEDVRIVLVFEDWSGMSGGAMWQDLRMGVEHLTHWKKIALVTDIDWMVHVTHLFGWITPGELRHFPLSERAAAVAWAAE